MRSGNPMRSKECPLDQRELELVPLLKGVDFDSIQDILNSSPVKELKAGEVLIRAGEVNEYLYLLLAGHLRVHLDFKMDPVALLEPG